MLEVVCEQEADELIDTYIEIEKIVDQVIVNTAKKVTEDIEKMILGD